MGKCTVTVADEFIQHMFNLDLFSGKMYDFRPDPKTGTVDIDIEVAGLEGKVEAIMDKDKTLIFRAVKKAKA